MLKELKIEVCEANMRLMAEGLVVQTRGNVSGIDREGGHVVIKPSGGRDEQPKAVDGAVHIQCDQGNALVPRLIEAFPSEITSITVGKPTLEDVFLHLTGHRLWEQTTAGEGGGQE